jgi:hypothetical protein
MTFDDVNTLALSLPVSGIRGDPDRAEAGARQGRARRAPRRVRRGRVDALAQQANSHAIESAQGHSLTASAAKPA